MLTKEQAIKDCQEIWKRLAITGENEKWKAIQYLYNKGLISQEHYSHYCPLCEYAGYDDIYEMNCYVCPWPGRKLYRCQNEDEVRGLYGVWIDAEERGRKALQRAASAIYQLMKTLK